MHIDIRQLLVLSCIPGIGPNRLRSLVSHFKDTDAIGKATARDLIRVEGIERKIAHTIANFFRDSGVDKCKRYVDTQLSRLNKADGRIITFWEEDYPANLKKIYDPPPYLFIRGQLTERDQYSIAIVGTRHPSTYGIQVAEKFASELSRLGLPIISGLARGIDTAVHAATVKAGGCTMAVIGSGIDVIYPPENRNLVDRLLEGGALISEYPMGAKPDAGNFPRRNRIISGIAIATLVVETGLDGGAMITASTALEQNREVFAIPTLITDRKRSGTNALIKQGKAKLTETLEDVVEELHMQLKRFLNTKGSHEETLPPLSLFEQRILEVLSGDPVHIDSLAEKSGLTTSDALVHLLSLEFKGIVKQMPGKQFLRM